MKSSTMILFHIPFTVSVLICHRCPTSPPDQNNIDNRVLFYAVDPQNDFDVSIHTTNADGKNLVLVMKGRKYYPTWMGDKHTIAYQDANKSAIMIKDLNNPQSSDALLVSYTQNMMFLWYAKPIDSFVFSFNINIDRDNTVDRIGIIDNRSHNFSYFNTPFFDEEHPITICETKLLFTSLIYHWKEYHT